MSGVVNITRGTVAVLEVLLATGGSYPAQVATQVRDSRNTVYRVLGRLAEDGHATVTRDGRHKRYTLTPAGVAWAQDLIRTAFLPKGARKRQRFSQQAAANREAAGIPPAAALPTSSGSGR